jgi:hypothetical protein
MPPPGYSGEMPPPGYGMVPPGQMPPPEKKKRRGLLVALALLVVVGIGVAAFVVLQKDDTGGGEVGGQVRLEPVAATGDDPFSDDLDVEGLANAGADVLAGVPTLGTDVVASLAGLSTPGTEPGLYGGSQDVQTCDVQPLVDFLTADANADKAEAWAGVLGVDVDEIPDYIATLTAVRLRFDTRVTNHGFRDGEATGFQSVLQAGTAVLVDAEGIPRVKCNCGNPLGEPQPLGDLSDEDQANANDITVIAENPEAAWPGFDPGATVAVTPGDEATTFVVVSPEGRIFERPVGTSGDADERIEDTDQLGDLCDVFSGSPTCVETTLGSGDVQATLRWSSSADLDLHVTEPGGIEIYFSAPGPTPTGGQLDVDSNVNCVPESGVENVFWPDGGAPAGDYVVAVNGFNVGSECGGGDYELTIKVSGQDDQVITDTVAEGETDEYPVSFDG